MYQRIAYPSVHPVCRQALVKVPFFDDAGSFLHAVLGFVAAWLPEFYAAAIEGGFLLYQMLEVEALPNKIGDFAEFGVGLLAGRAARYV